MKYALISEEQIKQVQDALEPVKASFAAQAVLEIIRSLKPSKPVAWLTTEPFAQTGISITTVTLHQQMSGTPLYALDEVTK